ncbi:MAG: methylmalonyl Co-A mutase-associated GTPase MeaB [Saprospiraceae bacterium]
MEEQHFNPSDDSPQNLPRQGAAPISLNPNLSKRVKSGSTVSSEELVKGILAGDRVALGKAITLVESTKPIHQAIAQRIIEACIPFSGQSLRLGITGTPGVGKSTFIEVFGQYLIQQGHRPAILAIDPSSQLSKGSILGDKTRMEKLATHPAAFIRPSPTGGSLGGVARSTRETILLCEAAKYDVIIIETVGVGQSETTVHAMVDFFLLLLLPGAGDELQGIKRGIVEMADLIAVNKADGDRQQLATQAKLAYRNALHLFPPKESQWIPQVHTCSSLQAEGLEPIWQAIQAFLTQVKTNGFFEQQRKKQALFWLHESIKDQLGQLFYQHPAVTGRLAEIEAAVLRGQVSPFKGASELLSLFVNN